MQLTTENTNSHENWKKKKLLPHEILSKIKLSEEFKKKNCYCSLSQIQLIIIL